MTQPPPQSPPSNPNFYPVFPWPMWTPPATPPAFRPPDGKVDEDDDSWEVRAFAEDTGSLAGTTWPPRSYTCTFCRREFRSAQALGGHMNVHRRDRARLRHQDQQLPPLTGHVMTPASAVEFFHNDAGFCVVCQQLSNSCTGVLVDAELSVPEAEMGIKYDEREDEDDQDGAAAREIVEVDLELRLGN